MTSYRRIDSQRLLCPSAHCEEGALLVGVIGAEGKIAYINPALPVDKSFRERAFTGRTPEHRFRFAATCQESGCMHWTGTRCGVIDQAIEAAEATKNRECVSKPLPKCGIRMQCRWFAQRGSYACGTCPFLFNYVWPDTSSGGQSSFQKREVQQPCQIYQITNSR